MDNLKNVIYLSNEDYETLVSTGTVTIDGTTLTYDENNLYITPDTVATQTADGLMSASDKVKLDGLDDSNLVHKTGAETITGSKNFSNGLSVNSRRITAENGYFVVRNSSDSSNVLLVGDSQVMSRDTVPVITDYYNLGSSSYTWKNLYLSRNAYIAGGFNPNTGGYKLTLPDTTSWTADKIIATTDYFGFKEIPAPSSTTLTNDEVASIIGGAVVKGSISGISNKRDFVFFPANPYAGGYYGFLVGSDPYASEYIGQYIINQNTKVLSIYLETQIADNGIIFNTTIKKINSKDVIGYYLNNVYAYATNSTTELKYETINNISISANTTFTLATAPSNTYPEYKANITNTDTSNEITITLTGVSKIKTNDSNITIVEGTDSTFSIPAETSIELNIQNGKAIVFNWAV